MSCIHSSAFVGCIPISLFQTLLFTLLQMSPFSNPLPTSFPLSVPHCSPCPWLRHTCSLATPFTFFHPVPSPLTALYLSVGPCCSSVHLIRYIARESICYLLSTHWPISLGVMFSRSPMLSPKVRILSFLTDGCYSIVQMYHSCSYHSS